MFASVANTIWFKTIIVACFYSNKKQLIICVDLEAAKTAVCSLHLRTSCFSALAIMQVGRESDEVWSGGVELGHFRLSWAELAR